MIKLENKDYYKAITPLSHVNINTLFAEAVIEQRIPGNVYVDCDKNPCTFYIVHPYGMSLLFGDSDNEPFNCNLFDYITDKKGIRHKQEWLQVDPAGGWTDTIDSMLQLHNSTVDKNGDSLHADDRNTILRNTRVNFRFNREAYQKKMEEQFLSHDHEVVRTTKELFLTQPGSVNPRNYWRDGDQFLADGVGYSLLCAGEMAATAFSAFINEHQLEIGIETLEAHRGKGYAFSVCSALIKYCLCNQLEPVWACRLENEGSYKLALRLGFEAALTIPYYRLVESSLSAI